MQLSVPLLWLAVCVLCSPVVLAPDLSLPALLGLVPRIVTKVLRFTSFYIFSNERTGVCLDQHCSEVVKTEMALGREIVRPVRVTLNSKTDDGAGPPFARQAAGDIVAITK